MRARDFLDGLLERWDLNPQRLHALPVIEQTDDLHLRTWMHLDANQ